MAEKFYTLLTNAGRAAVANAAALGTKVDLKTLVLGDANGSYYNPTETQETVRNEVWRGAISIVRKSLENPSWIIVEALIPGTVGGFEIREAGILDEAGNLLVIGKYPLTYKPKAADGSVKDLVIRVIIEVSNASVVNLKIDPTVIFATKQEIIELSTLLDQKADKNHKHTIPDVTGLQEALNAVTTSVSTHHHDDRYLALHGKADSAVYADSTNALAGLPVRNNNGPEIQINEVWYKLSKEGDSMIKSIQRGTMKLERDTNITDQNVYKPTAVYISPINPQKAMVLLNGTAMLRSDMDFLPILVSVESTRFFVSASFTSDYPYTISWQVIEFI